MRAAHVMPSTRAASSAVVPARSFSPIRPRVQAKLTVGPVDDPLEREADRVAEAVVAGQAAPGTVQRKCAACEEEEQRAMRKPAGAAPTTTGATLAAPPGLGGGSPLPADVRAALEPRFCRSFAGVRVHTNSDAAASAMALNARAYTLGRDIAFAPGQYRPYDRDGQHLLAHELAHVVQQEAGAPKSTIRRKLAVEKPSSLIPNPGGKGLKQTNADTIQSYLTTLCKLGAPTVSTGGDVSLGSGFCKGSVTLPVVGMPSVPLILASGTPAGCGCLCDLIASANVWTIKVDDAKWPHTDFDDFTKAVTPGSGGTGGVVTAPSPNSPNLWGAGTISGKALDIDPWLVLGHELCGHAWQGDQGGHAADVAAARGRGGHQATVARENLIRREHGIEERGSFKDPNCGESYFREKSKPADINWSSYLDECKKWRREYNKAHGTKYTISDKIP